MRKYKNDYIWIYDEIFLLDVFSSLEGYLVGLMYDDIMI